MYKNKPDTKLADDELAIFEENSKWYYLSANSESSLIDLKSSYLVNFLAQKKKKFEAINDNFILLYNPQTRDGKNYAREIIDIVTVNGCRNADFNINHHFPEKIESKNLLINQIIPVIQGMFQKETAISALNDDMLHKILVLVCEGIPFEQAFFGDSKNKIKTVYEDRANETRATVSDVIIKSPIPNSNTLYKQGSNKIIGGLLLCFAGLLSLGLAAALATSITGLSMGISAPLSLGVGISLGIAGSAMLISGIGLVYSATDMEPAEEFTNDLISPMIIAP